MKRLWNQPAKKRSNNTYLYYTKKDWLKINVALTFSLSILQWYRDCTHHASRDLLASWLGCVWCSSPYRLPSLSNSVGNAWITPRSVHRFICILLLLAGSWSAIAYILVCSISRNTWSRRLIMEEQRGSKTWMAKKGWNLRAHFWDKTFFPVSLQYQTWQPLVDDFPIKNLHLWRMSHGWWHRRAGENMGKLPPATSALNCSSMSMAFGRPGLWGRSASDAPRCAKYIHSQKSIDGSGIYAMILLHIHVILRLERISKDSKVIPSHWSLVLVTSTFYVLFFAASLFFPLAGLCQRWHRLGLTSASASWPPGMWHLSPGRGPEQSSGSRPSPAAPREQGEAMKNRPTDFHWFPMRHGFTCHNMICGHPHNGFIYLKNHLSCLFPYLGGSSWKSKICRDLCFFKASKSGRTHPPFFSSWIALNHIRSPLKKKNKKQFVSVKSPWNPMKITTKSPELQRFRVQSSGKPSAACPGPSRTHAPQSLRKSLPLWDLQWECVKNRVDLKMVKQC